MKKIIRLLSLNNDNHRQPLTPNERALRKSFMNVFIATFILLGILGVGSIGYVIIEDMNHLDALWMTVITMSTVGFGEVTPLHPAGRVLTIIIILATIMVGGYAIGNIGAFIFGGEVLNILKGRKLEKEIEKLNEHFILVGFGRVGKEAAAEFPRGKLVVVEQDPAAATEAIDSGYLTIEGDSTNDSILINAGIKKAIGIMIASGDIAHNVLISLTARELNPKISISARGDDYRSEARLKRAGADMVVLPHKIGGRRMAEFLKHPHVII
ncbi:potassium channel family protein [bacterium]|nr:potassium channel family protein [bacterium]